MGGHRPRFRLEGHPKATRAYAWSSPIEGSDKRRFYAVLLPGTDIGSPFRTAPEWALTNKEMRLNMARIPRPPNEAPREPPPDVKPPPPPPMPPPQRPPAPPPAGAKGPVE
jgi:hypothetical protein